MFITFTFAEKVQHDYLDLLKLQQIKAKFLIFNNQFFISYT